MKKIRTQKKTPAKEQPWGKYTVCISSDWQFAEYARLSRIAPSGLTTRLEDYIEAFAWMMNLSAEQGVYTHVILGDLFDDRVSVPVSVLDVVGKLFDEAHALAEFHLLVGNHDSALRNPSITSLQVLRGFGNVYSAPRVANSMAFIPWTENLDLLRKWVDQAADAGARVLFSHAMVQGAVPMAKGIPVDVFQPERFDRVILGDVHDPVTVEPNIQYAGAPLQINFGDAGKKRGVWFLDTVSGRFEFFENPVSPKFHNVEPGFKVGDVGPRDFVKVRIEDYEVAESFIADLSKGGFKGWVQSEAVEVLDDAPRLEVHGKDKTEDILLKYCEHVGAKDAPELAKLGNEILKEASNG